MNYNKTIKIVICYIRIGFTSSFNQIWTSNVLKKNCKYIIYNIYIYVLDILIAEEYKLYLYGTLYITF